MVFNNKYKEAYFNCQKELSIEKDMRLDKETEWNNEREELLARCHKAEIERQKEIQVRIKAEKDYNSLYWENTNLKNNLEINKSTNAKLLKDNSVLADKCNSQT